MSNLIHMTNATKGQIIVAINSILGLLVAFDVILTQAQIGAVDLAVNAILSLWMTLTFTQSVKRVQ